MTDDPTKTPIVVRRYVGSDGFDYIRIAWGYSPVGSHLLSTDTAVRLAKKIIAASTSPPRKFPDER